MRQASLLCCLAFGLSLVTALPAHAQKVSGPAEAIDGDTLALTGMRVLLLGIDAVEAGQTCRRGGTDWACGQEAKALLARLVEGRQVECSGQESDRYGRLVAVCRVDRRDLAERLIGAGLAVALPDFSEDYVYAEMQAREARIGIWSAEFDLPADWREAHPRADAPAERVADTEVERAPAPRVYRDSLGRCAIKGNRSRRGEWIYHLPGRPYYAETRPEERFCTEEAALRAGYRPSRAR